VRDARSHLPGFKSPDKISLYVSQVAGLIWITIGLDDTGILRVVTHTFAQTDRTSCIIRLISARKATFTETQVYQERKL
jgi:uncharacterized DUF497 family protein